LRPDDQFLAPSGRWTIKWDDDGKISDSMRPPPLNPVETGGKEEEAELLEDLPDAAPQKPSEIQPLNGTVDKDQDLPDSLHPTSTLLPNGE
jgi:hypothetical protein